MHSGVSVVVAIISLALFWVSPGGSVGLFFPRDFSAGIYSAFSKFHESS
jgi:hypothetical protein